MDPFHFSCPQCAARLRIRDKLYVGRQFPCPECRGPLKISESSAGLIAELDSDGGQNSPHGGESGQTASPSTPTAAANPSPGPIPMNGKTLGKRQTAPGARDSIVARSPMPVPGSAWWLNPQFLAWTVASGITAAVLSYVFLFNHGTPVDTSRTNGPSPDVAASDPPDSIHPNTKTDSGESDEVADVPPSPTELRLTRLGSAIKEHLESTGAFPPGTIPAPGLPAERRFGWLATLTPYVDPGSAPLVDFNRPWDDPFNDAFVRRRIPAYHNPTISELAGIDGYPATHFVGVAGVGPDARRLVSSHPRAGIFGDDRVTREEDVRDGLSQTLLVLGVRNQLGAWAAGGNSTIRSLTKEPYVNGPDGFGTGQPDSMLALMADGSVRNISAAVDPQVLRQMAAIADGLPEESVGPGELSGRPMAKFKTPADPDESPLAALLERQQRERDLLREPLFVADDPPLAPEFAPEPRRIIDVSLSLQQRIVRFEQNRSSPLVAVLAQMEELIGAEIRYDANTLGPAAARLKEPVALRLEKATLGEILAGLLRPAGLTYRIEENRIHLIPRPEK